ncbi:protein translocase subunit SecD [Candidatus Viadribacter manganicus]|uniref:Protein translocase subunit SecD n=1 Tax=Candidatus Viadribacter manganicus TaxID=1759059 RepID=A0A1B1ADV2_9PROT|nr:protein translocase subunit SecD [Candidatus Viadribacter manganicus]ANP44732.1 preprotein translocase subunit SecD [Candidatus Viadribacter manganicus]
MLKLPRWRVVLVIIFSVLGLVFAMPNVLPPNVREHIPTWLPHQTLNLGLDLQGGSHLLLEVDTETLHRNQLDNIAEQMASTLREAEPAIRYTGRGVVGDAARVRLIDPTEMRRALEVLRPISRSSTNGNEIIAFTEGADGAIEGRMTPASLRELSRQAAQQSIEVIRRRVDPTGANEINPVRQGENRIVVQAPGVSDPEMLKDRIGTTALMTFHMVREVEPGGALPPGTMLVQPDPEMGAQPEVVERRPRFTGERLVSATPSTDSQTGEFVLSFRLDSEGTRLFCRITRDNTGQRFAILLDNQVLTAPRINEPICGGSGQISGNFTAQSANDLAIMLRAGALPAPLTVIEQRTVTAELGQDAVDAGTKATLYGGIAVVLFMVLAYGMFGVLACLALVINIAMIIGVMSITGATLSLPGIAGLVLTMGMAVDANVLIYERMREEQANGRGPALAIDAGFARALVTIIDSHVTQIGVALILFWFGHGPVRGFAWTLSIGVVTSVITATLVTQFFIAIWFRLVRPQKLPI